MVTQNILDQIIKHTIVPTMKNEEFKKSGKNFYKGLQELGWCLQLQSNKWNTIEQVEMRINTGIFIPFLYELEWKQPLPKFPKEYDCIGRKSVGELKSLKQDYWYQIDTSTDIDQLSQKIKDDLENTVLPYFEDYQTLHGVVEGIQNKKLSPGGFLNYAILLAMIGEIETAKRLLEKEYRNTPYGSQRAVIKRMSKELSIELQLTK